MRQKLLNKKLTLKKSTIANLNRDEQDVVRGGLYTTTRWSGYQFVCDSEPENTCDTCPIDTTVGSGDPSTRLDPSSICIDS